MVVGLPGMHREGPEDRVASPLTCCWAELDPRADLGVRIRHLLASPQSLVQALQQPARQEGQGEPHEVYGG
jgi:hypothetical protein